MTEISELEKLYTPSFWCKRFTRDILLQKYEELTTTFSNKVRIEIPCELNIPYGTGARQKLDIFGTTLPKDAPIFVFLHGGYWQEGEKDSYSFIANSLIKKGCKTIIVGYTLCPEKTIPGIIGDIQQSIKMCLNYAMENGSRSLIIGGHSAGAHLLISLFPKFFNELAKEEKAVIKSIFLMSGLYNLTPLVNTTMNVPLKLTEDSAKVVSPMFQNYEDIPKDSPHFFVIVGRNESPAFVKQSELFAETLKKQSANLRLVLLEDTDHFDLIEKMYDEQYEIVEMIVNSF